MIFWRAHHDHACPFQGRQFKVEPIEIVLQSHFLLWSEGPPFSAFAELRLFLRNHVLKPLLLVLGPPRAAWICSTPVSTWHGLGEAVSTFGFLRLRGLSGPHGDCARGSASKSLDLAPWRGGLAPMTSHG